MGRNLVSRLESHYLRHAPRSRWRPALTLAAVAGAVGLLAPTSARKDRRAAIRVDCTAPLSCPLAESVALDVWSEHRGGSLPLDVVVTADTMPRLSAAGVSFQILEPDIDAAARAEADRIEAESRLAQQARIDELIRRDDEARARAAEAAGQIPERKSECTLAHEFNDAANAKEWLNLSQTQRDRLRAWVIDKCKDPLGRPLDAPEPAEPVTL